MQFYLQKMKPLHGTTQTLTRGSQRLRLTVNIEIGLPRSILQGFIKLEDQICELNYRGSKSEIRDKVGDQFCNFAYFLINHSTLYLSNMISSFFLFSLCGDLLSQNQLVMLDFDPTGLVLLEPCLPSVEPKA